MPLNLLIREGVAPETEPEDLPDLNSERNYLGTKVRMLRGFNHRETEWIE